MFFIEKKVQLFKKLAIPQRESIYRMAARLYSMATIDKRLKEFEEFRLIIINKEGRRIKITITEKGKKVLNLVNELEDAMSL